MKLIGKTANCLLYVIAYSAVLKAVDEFVRMREITRSVKVAIKCLIACIRSCQQHFTAHAQKRLFRNFR